MKQDPVADALIDKLFATMVARAPRRPSMQQQIKTAPDCDRITLPFGRLRKRWKKHEPIPRDTQSFAAVLQQHGVYIFDIKPGYIECQAAQSKIAKALGS